MLGSKDALRIVPYFVLPQFYPIFAYREADAPLLCSYRGGSLSHKTTPVQAHRGFRLLTLASYNIINTFPVGFQVDENSIGNVFFLIGNHDEFLVKKSTSCKFVTIIEKSII